MGCTVAANRHGYLALRLYWRARESWEGTKLEDTPDNRARVTKIATAVAAEIAVESFTPERYLHYFPGGNRSVAIRAELGMRAEADRKAAGPTLREYGAEWLPRQAVPVQRKTYYRKAASHLKALYRVPVGAKLLGDIPLRDLTTGMLADVRTSLLMQRKRKRDGQETKETLKLKTVKNIMKGTLGALLSAAVADNHRPANPLRQLKWKKTPPKRITPLSDLERDCVLEFFADKKSIYLPFLSTLLLTGMRIGEVSALRWGDVDLARGKLDITKSRTMGEDNPPKTEGSVRAIDMLPEVVSALAAAAPLVRETEGFVFCGRDGGPLNTQNFYQRHWLPALAKLKLAPRTLYQCRHTFLTVALSNGMNLKFAAQYCGTSVAMIEKHYARWIVPAGDQMSLIRGGSRNLSEGSRPTSEKTNKNNAE